MQCHFLTQTPPVNQYCTALTMHPAVAEFSMQPEGSSYEISLSFLFIYYYYYYYF